jgi:hypothetical protein
VTGAVRVLGDPVPVEPPEAAEAAAAGGALAPAAVVPLLHRPVSFSWGNQTTKCLHSWHVHRISGLSVQRSAGSPSA